MIHSKLNLKLVKFYLSEKKSESAKIHELFLENEKYLIFKKILQLTIRINKNYKI